MIMAQKLANELTNCLYCLAISAYGEIAGNPDLPVTASEACEIWARVKFSELCDEWATFVGKEWRIVPDEEDKTTKYLNPLCPHCSAELTLCTLPEIDCTEDTVSVETEYECTKCGKNYIFRTEGKVTEWSEPIIEEE